MLCGKEVNFLPNDKILDLSKFKAFADGNIISTQELKFVFGKVENIVGKGENAGYQHLLLFPQCFQKLSFPEVLKVRIVQDYNPAKGMFSWVKWNQPVCPSIHLSVYQCVCLCTNTCTSKFALQTQFLLSCVETLHIH